MSDIKVRIDFLHDARPYISGERLANTIVSFPVGTLPNKWDIIQIDGITHPKGAFFVKHRVFESREGSLCAISLTLGVEGVHDSL